jgi:hypothetical protein
MCSCLSLEIEPQPYNNLDDPTARIADFTDPTHRAFSSPPEKTPIEDRLRYTLVKPNIMAPLNHVKV